MVWTLRPSKVRTGTRSVTRALQWIFPRVVEMVTQSVFFTPFSAASSGLISAKSSGCSSLSQGIQRPIAGYGVGAPGVGVRAVGGRLGRLEIGNVVANPLLLLLVPPNVLLVFAPGLSFGIGRCAVVENTAGWRPPPAPLPGPQRVLASPPSPPGQVLSTG